MSRCRSLLKRSPDMARKLGALLSVCYETVFTHTDLTVSFDGKSPDVKCRHATLYDTFLPSPRVR